MKTHNSFDEQYQFTGKLKTGSLIAIVIGVIAILAGFLTGQGQRTFSNLLLNGYYFTCVCSVLVNNPAMRVITPITIAIRLQDLTFPVNWYCSSKLL